MSMTHGSVRRGIAASSAMILALTWTSLVLAQAKVEAEADRVLRAMSTYLTGINSFSADYDIDTEHMTEEGEKLQFSAWGQVSVVRPDKVHVVRHGGLADIELVYDGKQISVVDNERKAYAQVPLLGTLEDAVDFLRSELALEMPGGDLLLPGVYEALMEDVKSGAYWGTTHVGGVDCHYLAFRGVDVDWQIWISTGDRPLPMKLVITSKWMTAAPQYALRLSNWKTGSQVPADRFLFKPSADARKLDGISADLVGEQQRRK